MNDKLREHPYTRVTREVLIISCKNGQDFKRSEPEVEREWRLQTETLVPMYIQSL